MRCNLVGQVEADTKVTQGMHEVHEEAELGLAQQLVAVHVTQTPHLFDRPTKTLTVERVRPAHSIAMILVYALAKSIAMMFIFSGKHYS